MQRQEGRPAARGGGAAGGVGAVGSRWGAILVRQSDAVTRGTRQDDLTRISVAPEWVWRFGSVSARDKSPYNVTSPMPNVFLLSRCNTPALRE